MVKKRCVISARIFKNLTARFGAITNYLHVAILLAFTACVAFAPVAHAQELNALNSLNKWVEQVRASGAEKKALQKFPLQVIFVTGNTKGGAPEFLNVDKGQFDALGLFEVARSQDILWSLRVRDGLRRNKQAAVGSGETDKTAAQFLRLQSVSDVEILVSIPSIQGAPWDVAMAESTRAGANVSAFAKSAPDVEVSASGIHNWLEQQVGYNGIVVAQKDNQLLVYASKDSLTPNSQAVFFDSSTESRRVFSASARALLLGKIKEHAGNYAIFEAVVGDMNARVPVGTRVFVQSSL